MLAWCLHNDKSLNFSLVKLDWGHHRLVQGNFQIFCCVFCIILHLANFAIQEKPANSSDDSVESSQIQLDCLQSLFIAVVRYCVV